MYKFDLALRVPVAKWGIWNIPSIFQRKRCVCSSSSAVSTHEDQRPSIADGKGEVHSQSLTVLLNKAIPDPNLFGWITAFLEKLLRTVGKNVHELKDKPEQMKRLLDFSGSSEILSISLPVFFPAGLEILRGKWRMGVPTVYWFACSSIPNIFHLQLKCIANDDGYSFFECFRWGMRIVQLESIPMTIDWRGVDDRLI